MKGRTILWLGFGLLALLLLPVAAALYVLAQYKGAGPLVWPVTDLGALDPDLLLSRFGIDLASVSRGEAWLQLADGSGRAEEAGNACGARAVTGSGGITNPGPRLPCNDSFCRGAIEGLIRIPEDIGDRLFGNGEGDQGQPGQTQR